jgi:hypothetical protein
MASSSSASSSSTTLKFQFPKNTPQDELKYFYEFVARFCCLNPIYQAGSTTTISRKTMLTKFQEWIKKQDYPVTGLTKQKVFFDLLPALFTIIDKNQSRYQLVSGKRVSLGPTIKEIQWRLTPDLSSDYQWAQDVKIDAFGSFSYFGRLNTPLTVSTEPVRILFDALYEFEEKYPNFTVGALVSIENLSFFYAPPQLRHVFIKELLPKLNLNLGNPNTRSLRKMPYEPDGVIGKLGSGYTLTTKHKDLFFPRAIQKHVFSSFFMIIMPLKPVFDFNMITFQSSNLKFKTIDVAEFTQSIRLKRMILKEHPHNPEGTFKMVMEEVIYDAPFATTEIMEESKKEWYLELKQQANTKLEIPADEVSWSDDSDDDSNDVFFLK